MQCFDMSVVVTSLAISAAGRPACKEPSMQCFNVIAMRNEPSEALPAATEPAWYGVPGDIGVVVHEQLSLLTGRSGL